MTLKRRTRAEISSPSSLREIIAIVRRLRGTHKGAMVYRSDADRKRWEPVGFRLEGWGVTATARDAGGRTYAAVNSAVYGAAVLVSDDLERWEQLTTADGLPDDHVFAIKCFEDKVWIGTENGLACLDQESGTIESWTEADGQLSTGLRIRM